MIKKKFGFLKNSFLDLWQLIKTKKLYLFLILVLQIIATSILSYIIITGSITLAEDLQNLTTPLEELNLEDPNISEQEILASGAVMYAAYETLADHIVLYLVYLALLFLTIPGFIWSLSKLVVEEIHPKKDSFKQKAMRFLNYYKTFLIISVVTFLPISIITFITGKSMLSSDLSAFSIAIQILTGVWIVLVVLWLMALLVPRTDDWRSYFKKFKLFFPNKLLEFLVVLIIVAIPTAGSTYLLYYSTLIMEHFLLMLLASALFFLSIIFARLLLIISSKHFLVGVKD